MTNGKRKRDRIEIEHFAWPITQLAFVLAWNNRFVLEKDGRSYFRETVVREFEERWKRDDPPLKWKFVDRELRKIHKNCHDNSEKGVKRSQADIFEKGTDCLDFNFVEQWKPGLTLALKEAEAQLESDFGPRSDPQSQSRQSRAARSRSTATTGFSQRVQSHHAEDEVECSGTKISRPQPAPAEAAPRPKSLKIRQGQRLVSQAPNESSSDVSGTKRLFSVDIAVKDSDTDVGDFRRCLSSEGPLSTSGESPIPPNPPVPSTGQLGNQATTQASTIKQLQAQISALTSDNIRLHNELAIARQLLRDHEDAWHKANAPRNHENPSKTIYDLENYITKTRRALAKSKQLNNFFDKSEYATITKITNGVKRFQSIFSGADVLFDFDAETVFLFSQVHTVGPRTAELLERVFRLQVQRDAQGTCSFGWRRDESAQRVAKALTSTALQHWVYMESWPNFDEGQSQLFRAERECIGLGAGESSITI